MGLLEELEREEKEKKKASKQKKAQAQDDEEMTYTEPLRTMGTDDVKVPRSSQRKDAELETPEETGRAAISTAAPPPRGKNKEKPKVTIDRIFQRVMKVPLLQLIAVLIMIGMVFALLSAISYYDLMKDGEPSFEDRDDPSFIARYADEVAMFCFELTSLMVMYVFLSVQYRKRFKKTEDGTRVTVVPPVPGKPGKKLASLLAATVPLLMLLILIFSLYSTAIFWEKSGDDYNLYEDDNYKQLHWAEVFYFLLVGLIPVSFLFLAAGTPRGLKKTGKYLRPDNYMAIFLLAGIILLVLGLVFRIVWANEFHNFRESFADYLNSEGMGKIPDWPDRKIADYYLPMGMLFTLGVYTLAAFVLSNLKFRKQKDWKLEVTPGLLVFSLGLLLKVCQVIIDLTIFNSDYEYDGDFLGWSVLVIIIANFGLFFMLGGMVLLMVEHTLANRIKAKHLCLMPDVLWGEMVKKNHIFRKIFS